MTRHLVRAFCLALVLTLAPAGSAQAVAAKSLTTCRTYDTHKMCVTLRRSTDGKVWATGYLDKLSGTSNLRYVTVGLRSRACQATEWNVRDIESDDPVWGDRTARATTTSVAWDQNLVYRVSVGGGWMRGTRHDNGGTTIRDRHDKVLVGRTLRGPGCDTGGA